MILVVMKFDIWKSYIYIRNLVDPLLNNRHTLYKGLFSKSTYEPQQNVYSFFIINIYTQHMGKKNMILI